ncbi:MAG: hypothetical protein J7605_00645 [Variovorax sp.]|nr:hypothetical protein [Variovorax sp.]
MRTTQQTSTTLPNDMADVVRGKAQRVLCSFVGAFAIWTLAACQHTTPSASIGVGNPYPVSNYVCDGTRLAVRLMGEKASVSVDGAAAVDLPAMGNAGTTFSNGRQTLLIEQGRTSWAVGRAMPVACTGG